MKMAINKFSANVFIMSVNNTISGITETIFMPILSSVSNYLGNTKGEFKENNSIVFSLQRNNVSDNNEISTIINTKYLHRNEMQKLQIKNCLCCHLLTLRRILICNYPLDLSKGVCTSSCAYALVILQEEIP